MKWFLSDLHIHHKNICNYTEREYSSVDAMNEDIISQWNKYIKPKDIAYVLGDFSFANYDLTLAVVKRLNGRKILIRGNHDYRFSSKDFIDMGFEDVRDNYYMRLSNGVEVLMCHYPYKPSYLKHLYFKYLKRSPWRTQYEQYPTDFGRWLLHGHHHSGKTVNGKRINVAMDVNNFKPLSETQICQIINESSRSPSYYLGHLKSKLKWRLGQLDAIVKHFSR